MRSDLVKKGSTRAAHRSCFYALGFSEEDLRKPLIAVVNAQSEIIPGHAHLDDQAKMVKYGVLAAAVFRLKFRPSVCATASPWAT